MYLTIFPCREMCLKFICSTLHKLLFSFCFQRMELYDFDSWPVFRFTKSGIPPTGFTSLLVCPSAEDLSYTNMRSFRHIASQSHSLTYIILWSWYSFTLLNYMVFIHTLSISSISLVLGLFCASYLLLDTTSPKETKYPDNSSNTSGQYQRLSSWFAVELICNWKVLWTNR